MAKAKKHREYNQITVSVGKRETHLIKRLHKIRDEYGISISKLIVCVLHACIGTIEKELPKSRVFKINGVDIRP